MFIEARTFCTRYDTENDLARCLFLRWQIQVHLSAASRVWLDGVNCRRWGQSTCSRNVWDTTKCTPWGRTASTVFSNDVTFRFLEQSRLKCMFQHCVNQMSRVNWFCEDWYIPKHKLRFGVQLMWAHACRERICVYRNRFYRNSNLLCSLSIEARDVEGDSNRRYQRGYCIH